MRTKPVTFKQVVMYGGLLEIRFTFNKATMQKVKTIKGRTWCSKNKRGACWSVVPSFMAGGLLKDNGFAFGPKAQEWWDRLCLKLGKATLSAPGLKMELYPYQQAGVSFMEAHDGCIVLGDEMGLGKTAQALAYMQLHRDRPTLLIVPATLKLNWVREIQQWMSDPTIEVLSGKKPPTNWERTTSIVIINYDILGSPPMRKTRKHPAAPAKGWYPALLSAGFQMLILDEGHYIKNPKVKRTKCALGLGKKIGRASVLTGTPIVNRPIEFFTLLNLVDSSLFPSYWHYAQRYCGAKHTGFGWDFTGASNTQELHAKVSRKCYLRRKKKDVLKELPPIVRTVIPMELDARGRREYEAEKALFDAWVKENRLYGADSAQVAVALQRIEHLKQAAVSAKLDQCLGWISDWVDTGEKLVVFGTHHATIDALEKAFPKIHVTIDGRMPVPKRQSLVDMFQQNDYCRLFFGNIKAAGTGLTLTAASNTCFLELPWTPGECDQSEARVHRIGQEADSVGAYYLLAVATIEMDIAPLLDEKRKVLQMVHDGEEVEETSLLSALMERYRRGRTAPAQ